MDFGKRLRFSKSISRNQIAGDYKYRATPRKSLCISDLYYCSVQWLIPRCCAKATGQGTIPVWNFKSYALRRILSCIPMCDSYAVKLEIKLIAIDRESTPGLNGVYSCDPPFALANSDTSLLVRIVEFSRPLLDFFAKGLLHPQFRSPISQRMLIPLESKINARRNARNSGATGRIFFCRMSEQEGIQTREGGNLSCPCDRISFRFCHVYKSGYITARLRPCKV